RCEGGKITLCQIQLLDPVPEPSEALGLRIRRAQHDVIRLDLPDVEPQMPVEEMGERSLGISWGDFQNEGHTRPRSALEAGRRAGQASGTPRRGTGANPWPGCAARAPTVAPRSRPRRSRRRDVPTRLAGC